MKLLIGIATYRRPEKLERLLRSIHDNTFQDFTVEIVCDNKDFDTLQYLDKKLWLRHVSQFTALVQPEQRFVIGAWNRVIQENMHREWDGFIGLCDDVELFSSSLEIIVDEHQKLFTDTDGVVGFHQKCPGYPNYTFKWFGQTLMGRKFVERYKDGNYQICCPDYKHFFQDQEMHEYASSLGKFAPCEYAILNHYHPGFCKNEMDETHDIIRRGHFSPQSHDMKMQAARQLKGYLWGRDFNLISKEQ